VFEVFELEEIQSRLQTEAVQNLLDTNDDQEITDDLFEEPEIEIPESQYVRKNLIEMPSKNMRIEISSDLLEELERMQVSFRLN
jgi:DNA polymerase-3 subunit alpha